MTTATINNIEITTDRFQKEYKIVSFKGQPIGLLRKIPNTKTETFPYQSLLMDGPKTHKPNTLCASCFPADHGSHVKARKASIEALLDTYNLTADKSTIGPLF